MVEEIVLPDPTYGTLAPRAEVTEPEERKSLVGTLLELLKEDPEPEPAEVPEPETIPTIQATSCAHILDLAELRQHAIKIRDPLVFSGNTCEYSSSS